MLILAIRCGKGATTRIRIDLVLPSDYNHNETIDQLNLSYPCDRSEERRVGKEC